MKLRGFVRDYWAGAGSAGPLLDGALLLPELLYSGAMRARNAAFDLGLRRGAQAAIPVISVGNLSVGGAGKTPVSAWLARCLRERGEHPGVIMRGYGEDELLLHAELNPGVPVLAAPRRANGVAEAARRGCTVAILDDGFQHRRLRRDLDLVLIGVEALRRPVRLLPRGPWREGLRALRRADVVGLVRRSATAGEAEERAAELAQRLGSPPLRLRLVPSSLVPLIGPAGRRPLASLAGTDVLALASVAWPDEFSAFLREAGAHPERMYYPDHHPYTRREVEEIQHRAAGRPVITTQKDAVKLRSLWGSGTDAWVLPLRVEVESGGGALDEALGRALTRGGA
jgi:tetraacyldisaccharide 4'-kinase